MKMKYVYLTVIISLLSHTSMAGKEIFHYISLPLIEGAGIYASVGSLTDDNSTNVTKAASITNLTFLGTSGILGIITVFSKDDARQKFRTIHRIMGFAISAVSVWLSISSSIDDVKLPPRIAAYTYSGLTLIPLFTFSF